MTESISQAVRPRVTVGRGVVIDRLGLGLAPIGNMFRVMSDQDAETTLDAWWAHGGRTFDVAPVYGYGIAERRLGRFLAGRPRDEITISTKVGRLMRRGMPPEPGLWMGDRPKFLDTPPGIESVFDFSRAGIRASLTESLERLGLERIDICYLHDPVDHLDQAIAEGLPALRELQDEGLVGAVGVGIGHVPTLLRFARGSQPDVFLLAGRWTLLDRSAGEELLPLCAARGIPVIACSVFNGGIIADPRPDATYDYGAASDAVLGRVQRLRAACTAMGIDPRAAALQFPMQHPAVVAVVVGARSAAQVDGLVAASEADIPAESWAALDAAVSPTVDPLARFGSAHVLGALSNARTGTVFDLGTTIGNDMPAGPQDTFASVRLSPWRTPRSLRGVVDLTHDFSMELISGSPHLGSHIDGLAHIQSEGRIFGGHQVQEVYTDSGWTVHGMEHVPPIVTRGILLDLPRDLGDGRPLPDGHEVSVDEVQMSLRRRGAVIQDGDAVLIRTGKMAADYQRDPAAYFGDQPGVGPDAAMWLHEQGMALLGTDTSGTEAHPPRDPVRTTHRVMIVDRGVHLLEILDLETLAASGPPLFLFVCLPLRITGGTGSWVRPIAIG